MRSVWMQPASDGKSWKARVGEAHYSGTHADCLQWLAERQAEIMQLGKEVFDVLATHVQPQQRRQDHG